MAEFGDLASISEAFVAAALDRSRWNAAMEAATRATNSFGALLVPATGQRLPIFPFSESMQPTVNAYLNDGWIHRDMRYNCVPNFLRSGVGSEFDFITSDEMARHPYYEEFLRPHKLRWFGGVRVGDGPDVWCLSIQRSFEQGPFSPAELRRLAGLSRRLSGAAELARAFGFARAEAALQAFEASGSAAATVDRNGEVLRLNVSAERLLGEDLRIVGRRITSSDRDATAALDRALHGLIWSRGAEALQAPIALPRRGRRAVLAYPSRLPESAIDGFEPCQGFVVLVDLDARLALAPAELSRAFGLTSSEARLAANLFAENSSIEAAAAKLGIAYETARNMLKSVFHKTNTHRQGELTALLARIARRPSNQPK